MERDLPLRLPWHRPERIELDEVNDRLLWGPLMVHVEDMPQKGALDEFIPLAECSGQAILDYARRWGVLEICCHDLPRAHRGEDFETRCSPLRHENPDEWLYVEPLATWRSLAARVRAIVNLAAGLRFGNLGKHEEWLVALAPDAYRPWLIDRSQLGPDGVGNPLLLADAVQELLVIGDVRPSFSWRGERGYGIEIGGVGDPRLTGYGPSLFGTIATQLAFTLSRSDGLAICSGCGRAFSASESRAKPGSNRYCGSCRANGVDARDRAKRYRQRQRANSKRG
jgi:hypothetical protein